MLDNGMPSDSVERDGRASHLVGVAMIGQAIGYMLSVLLARRLSLNEFEAYVVASAAFILGATFAARGAEKYTLLRLPAMLQQNALGLARGFLSFGARRTLLTAISFAFLLGAWAAWSDALRPEVRLAILVTCLSLPAGALMHYAVEVLSAAGRPLRALGIFKLFVPACAFLLILFMLWMPIQDRGALAIGCWGIAWAIALALTFVQIGKALPGGLWASAPMADTQLWRVETRPFFVYRLALALLAQTGVIALDLLQPSPVAVGAYAAAAGTVGLAAVLATSTNRAYGRQLSLLVAERDFSGLLRARAQRLRWLLPTVLALMAVALLFPRTILMPYGPLFAEEGAAPLRILALSTGFTVLFAMAPTYLKLRKLNHFTYAIVAAAAVAQILLLWALVPRFGATGAAIAHALSMGGLYSAFALIGWREVNALKFR